MTLSKVRRDGDLFVDTQGRQVILRGVNLGGDCKVPWPDGGTEVPTNFSDHREVSFIGRPFPLEEADEHLGRLKHWGFNLVRLLTTWEAVEHAGPGQYDHAYLDYLAEVCRRCGEHGLYVFIDFHQDVWSRMSGGDGAPGWTFEAVGLDFTRFHDAGAAHVMQHKFDYADPSGRQGAYPQMSWGSNSRLPANGIMWSLFWLGRRLTPDFEIDGRNVQDFLQDSYLGCLDQIARRVAQMPHVLGFDTLNEPMVGWIGEGLSYRHLAASEQNRVRPRPGPVLSPLDALAVARGLPTTVPVLKRNPATGAAEPDGERTINPDGVSIWLPGRRCPFEAAGAYRIVDGRAEALDEDYFRVAGGKPLDICDDGFGPLFHRVAQVIRRHDPTWPVFAEIDPWGLASGRTFPRDMPDNAVNAGHWYDAGILYLKRFDPEAHFDFLSGRTETGAEVIRERYVRNLAARKAAGDTIPGGAPCLVGEFGIPYDLEEGAAYEAWARGERDVWGAHVQALSLMYDAMDELLLHSAQWNYTASNRNDLRIGDRWNQEDLSIFSRDQQDDPGDPDSGGRAVEGFCRPYARRTQGRLTRMRFDRQGRRFEMDYEADPAVGGATELYVPRIQFPAGFVVRVEGIAADLVIDAEAQRVTIDSQDAGPARIIVTAP
jgi:hypothetical protein